MKYLLIAVMVGFSCWGHAQSDDARALNATSNKLKIDLFNLFDEYPALLLGYEYPLKDNRTAIEHELGLIINGGSSIRGIDRSTGFKTSHTFLMYSKNRKYTIGAGLHLRALNVEGQITVCGSTVNSQFGGCDFFRLYEDPIKIRRWAGYIRLRRQRYFGSRVMLSVGTDIGYFTRKVSNKEYDEGNLTLPVEWLRQDLNNGNGAYFRAHAQLTYIL